MEVEDGTLAAARSGDPVALDALLRTIRPMVLRRCARVLPYRQDAEEAAQEALLTVAERIGDYAGRGSFAGWVSAIATNQARMTYRSLRRRFAETGLAELPEAPDPRRVSIIAGSRVDLMDAIDALEATHPETVEAFLLRDVAGLAYSDIAVTTGAPLGTVKARIHTARRFVRGRLVDADGTR
ncbi:RNA polymerase sigma-70 factor (ECF subfamily) [Mumia flava]|uniref:RNA polymerase sigma-70 factor (ECF subfamily) n=1 Tax=Mumia flava TaxID=1348852 RepID=A0A0B2BSY9_9ACTN|nr:RNA polymerase sigma factor [Mumia flava]PJJ57274.1 RNA polymerase sigma-70 factor (ECF subfamily) [Mumia flava]